MTPEDVAEYVGIPYENGALGPNSFNCWGLLVHVERKYFNVSMPVVDIECPEECAELFRMKLRGGDWCNVIDPVDGDAVLLRGGTAPHVGIYVHGGVLHALEGVGVIWTNGSRLRAIGFSNAKYYRLK